MPHRLAPESRQNRRYVDAPFCERFIELEDRRNAGIPLFAGEDAVREHQDSGNVGRNIPTVFGKAIKDPLKRLVGGFGRKVAAPVSAGQAGAYPGV